MSNRFVSFIAALLSLRLQGEYRSGYVLGLKSRPKGAHVPSSVPKLPNEVTSGDGSCFTTVSDWDYVASHAMTWTARHRFVLLSASLGSGAGFALPRICAECGA